MAFTAGQKLRASDLNNLGSVVGRNIRTTNSSAFTTTLTRILSVRAPVKAGRSYRINVYGEILGAAGAVTLQNEIRVTTDDTEPTTSSTVAGRSLDRNPNTNDIPVTVQTEAYFNASADGFLRAVLCSKRVDGTVNCTWQAQSTAPMVIQVEDIGPTVSTDGTVY